MHKNKTEYDNTKFKREFCDVSCNLIPIIIQTVGYKIQNRDSARMTKIFNEINRKKIKLCSTDKIHSLLELKMFVKIFTKC